MQDYTGLESGIAATIFTIFLVLFFSMRVYWTAQAEKRPIQEDRSFLLDKVNIALVSVCQVVLPLLALFTHLFEIFDYRSSVLLMLASIPLFLLGLTILWIAHRDLGENWSATLELRRNHALVTRGIYGRIRHPIYAATWLCVLGQALCVPNIIGGFGVVLGWGLLYFVRIEREERMMMRRFGKPYANYVNQTKRLIPSLL